MWNAEQTRQIEDAQRATPKGTVEKFRRLAAAISDVTEVGTRTGTGTSTFDMLKPETRSLLNL